MPASTKKVTPEGEYWREAFELAIEGIGLFDLLAKHFPMSVREEIGESLAMSCENRSLAFHDPGPLYPSEVERLERNLHDERRKIRCRECNGRGTVTTYGGTFQSTSQCDRCHGEGRHLP